MTEREPSLSLKSMKRFKNIIRQDNDSRSTHAWLVQVQRKNRIMIKMFSDNLFGGKNRALTAACQYRDALIVAASPAAHNHWRRTILRRNNTSGIPGVSLCKRPSGTERWVAYWGDENGIRRSRSFAVSIHGDKAKEFAIAERLQQLQRIFEIISSRAHE